MSSVLKKLQRQLSRVQRHLAAEGAFVRYQHDPVGYIRDVLDHDVWSRQREICERIIQPPYRVEAKAAHSVGKTRCAACLISWFFDCFPRGLAITTAPSREAVEDQLWREVRIIRSAVGRSGFRGPTAPELWSAHDHWAKGFTTAKSEAFHGRHQEYMLFIVDEAVGVEPWVFDVIKSMFIPGGKHFMLIIGNPTDTSSQMYLEEFSEDLDGNPAYHVVQMSALDHPNIQAELRGQSIPYPGAVSLAQFKTWLADWCSPIQWDEFEPALDIIFPPLDFCAEKYHEATGKGVSDYLAGDFRDWLEAETDFLAWAQDQLGMLPYRPGPEMEGRGLGRWPSSNTYGVWSDALWHMILREYPERYLQREFQLNLPEIGCDVGRHGPDFTSMHVRCGPVSLHHERHNGWSTDRTAGRLKELCREYAAWNNRYHDKAREPIKPTQIQVKIDDGGVGGAVTDQAEEYQFYPVNFGGTAMHAERYPNKRSELWFELASRAQQGRLSIAPLLHDKKLVAKLRQQAMAPIWWQDGKGRRVLESKDETKRRLGIGSPDDLDAMTLAYYMGGGYAPPTPIIDEEKERRYNPWKKQQRRPGTGYDR